MITDIKGSLCGHDQEILGAIDCVGVGKERLNIVFPKLLKLAAGIAEVAGKFPQTIQIDLTHRSPLADTSWRTVRSRSIRPRFSHEAHRQIPHPARVRQSLSTHGTEMSPVHH